MPHSPSQAHADVFGSGTEPVLPGDKTVKDSIPSEVCDVKLWRYAWRLMNQHQPSSEQGGLCGFCGISWPCEPYRHGQADEVASRRQCL
jgi:hypothetical protein